MKKWSLLIATVFTFSFVQALHADLIELRGGFGINSASPDDFENRANNISGSDLSSDNFDNYNVDVFFNIPVLPIGVGLRHEWLTQDQSSSGSQWDLDAKNISLLVDWRLLDNFVYLGPIVSIGFPTADVNFDSGATHITDSIKSEEPSYGIGAEAGVKFSHFLIGAEAGYQSLKFKKIDSPSINSKVDLSGFYGKAMIGVTFF
jgi:hypothetical protein